MTAPILTTAPIVLPAWFEPWVTWRNDPHRTKANRPKGAPLPIPSWAWEERARLARPPIGLPTPFVCFRQPDFGTPQGGPAEIAPLMVAAGVKAIVIDPMVRPSWTEFLSVMRPHFPVIGTWTRVSNRNTARYFADYSASLGMSLRWANIEDDDLRAAQGALGGVSGFLSYVREIVEPVGVLTNYRASDLWRGMPLTEKPVGVEWFPREISDKTATLAGALEIAGSMFRTAFPLVDGRDAHPEGACVRSGLWVGDDVQDWSKVGLA